MPDRPVLLACSHGTASPVGRDAVASLVSAVRRAHPEVEVRAAYVDVQQPDVPSALEACGGREVSVVPLLLSAGYHVFVDLVEAVKGVGWDGVPGPHLAGALGPDEAIVAILADRLREAGVRDGDAVVLGAAGSSDPRAVADCAVTAEMLADLIQRPVLPGYLSAARPSVAEAVAVVRRAGADRVAVANYLLAPGYFDTLLRTFGAEVVTDPLLSALGDPDPRLVDRVWWSYLQAARG